MIALLFSRIGVHRLCAAFFIGFLLVPAATAQTFGVTIGSNFQRLSDITLNELETRFESQTGWHAGAWIEFPLGPAGLRIGGRYMDAGKLFSGLRENNSSVRDNFDVSLIELHLLLRLGLPSPVVSPHVFAGPVFRIPSGNDKEISDDLKILSYAGAIGGGLKIDLGPISLLPEIAYVFGITRFIENELILNLISSQVGDPQRLNTVMIRVSIGL